MGWLGLAGGFSVAVENRLQGGRIKDSVRPDVELVQRGGLEARGSLLVERAVGAGVNPPLFAGEVSFLASVPVNCHRPSEADNRR